MPSNEGAGIAAAPAGRLERLKRKILSAATKLFADLGYSAVTIRAIAKAAHTSLPILYYFYEDKRALYEACCVEVDKNNEQHFARVLAAVDDPMEIIYAFAIVVSHLHLRFGNTKLQFRFLLDRDHDILAKLSTHMFGSPSFARARDALAAIGENHGTDRILFMFVSVAAGAVLHAPIWHEDVGQDVDAELHDVDPRKLAEETLTLILPRYDWSSTAARAFPKIRHLLVELTAGQD